MAAPFQGAANALINGGKQAFRSRPIQDAYQTLSDSAKAATPLLQRAVPAGLGIVGAVGAGAGMLINKYGHKVSQDIEDMGNKTAAQNQQAAQNLKKALALRKAAKLKAAKKQKASDDTPMTKSPQGIGVGWGE